MGAVRRVLKRIADTWIAFQVELHGQYSFERMRAYSSFCRNTHYLRLILLCMLTPFPCLILITMIDAVPLAHPDEGTNANYVHWMRNYLTIVFISFAMLGQFPLSVPGLPLGAMRITVTALWASVGGVGFQFIMSHVIGFPLPFSLVIGTPMWFTFICVNFAFYFGKLLRDNEQFRSDLTNYFIVFIAQVSLTLIYPAYIYGFQSIDSASQNVYIVLLPIIKISLKNWMSRYLGQMDDTKPEIVIFNVEIFNALYVSCCMQSSTSITTTLILSLVDWFQAWLSIRDVNEMLDEVKYLMDKIPSDHAWKGKNFVDIALSIVDEDPHVKSHPSLQRSCINSERIDTVGMKRNMRVEQTRDRKTNGNVVPVTGTISADTTLASLPNAPPAESTNILTSEATGTMIKYALTSRARTESGIELFTDTERLHFVQKSTQLLFTTEFVLLVEYTEVIIPIIYSMYVVASYNLPNRQFYAQLAKMDTEELQRTVMNVFVYASFELVSFLLMTYILKRKLQIQSFKQLAFVLDSHWLMVQSKLVLWFFYAVQNSLTHFGLIRTHWFACFCKTKNSEERVSPNKKRAMRGAARSNRDISDPSEPASGWESPAEQQPLRALASSLCRRGVLSDDVENTGREARLTQNPIHVEVPAIIGVNAYLNYCSYGATTMANAIAIPLSQNSQKTAWRKTKSLVLISHRL